MHFETEAVRREVELYKDAPSAEAKRRMAAAFGALDTRVKKLEALAQTQSGVERTSTEQQIADLKRRRALHWARAQTAVAETQPVKRAEPVAERVSKAERANVTQGPKRSERASRVQPFQRTTQADPRIASPNFFQRLFR